MKKVKIVIGANFGDEGKGVITDYITRTTEEPVVIRFNSGSQAGHTVISRDGTRHVFGHFGSGTFNNVPTFLSKYFVVNPLIFLKERNELINKGVNPKVFVDSRCLITTPYDMMLNQMIENARGDKKHGSCGLGFNETLIRNKDNRYRLTMKEIDKDNMKATLIKIRDEYVIARLKEVNINSVMEEFKDILKSDDIIENFIYDVMEFQKNIQIKEIKDINTKYKTLIFEGAQGLMLHQDYKYFPHVTPSNTGIENVLNLLDECYRSKENELDIEAIYVTRAYLTRHGEGPMPGEVNEKPYSKIVDLTNIYNKYQGNLRFGLLNIDLLNENIKYDFNKAKDYKFKVKKSIAVTCIDQIDGNAKYIYENNNCESSIEKFEENIKLKIEPYNYYRRIDNGDFGKVIYKK